MASTGIFESHGPGGVKYQSKVVAPRNPKLIRNAQPETKLKPSQYLNDMSLDTEKKLASQHTMKIPKQIELLDMSEMTYQKGSQVNIDEPMFQPFPSEIFFQKFEPFKTYEIPLILRNSDKVPRLVKVTHKESPYFQVVSPPNSAQKVGAGLPTTYRVLFTPDDYRDYIHELICITEREKFVVPIHAVGARAILDFPDEVVFEACAVKYCQSRTILVRNIGNRDAKFALLVDKPFSVSPDNGDLAVGACMQITVEYLSAQVGAHSGEMVLHYDTGEDLYIALRGTSQDVAVRLEKSAMQLDATFISLGSQKTVTISNRSDIVAHFRWTRFATANEERQQKLTLHDSLSLAESIEKSRFLDESATDPTIFDKSSIITRSYKNKKRVIDEDQMLFTDEIMKIEPLEGDVWPNSTSEISIVFRPDAARDYSRIAFCDITGRESRLPLQICGTGLGPKVTFSFEQVDVGRVFVFSTHSFEVVLANAGAIDAIFSLVPPTTALGRCFRFDPPEGIVMPDGHQAISVTFSSRVIGDFVEDFFFQIDGAPEKAKITFCGSVVAPSLHFDTPKLEFGTVSYGFVTSRKCTLSNTSLVPITYYLHMAYDGREPSVRSRSPSPARRTGSAAFAAAVTPTVPKEFTIFPSSGLLAPQSDVEICIELCANTVRKFNTELCVDVEAVQNSLLLLPVTARCIVPTISVASPLLDLGRCFLCHPYRCFVELRNDSDLPAKYELVPCAAIDGIDAIIYSSPEPDGVIEPRSTARVPLSVTAQDLEELGTTVQFTIVGSHGVALPVQITCFGEGPVVHIMPPELDWGQINVLTDSPKTLRLSNESLIPANFTTKLVRGGATFRVEPSVGTVEPESFLDLVVTACLDDCLSFSDKLHITFENGPVRNTPLSAVGRGTTLTSDPPMTSVLDLGPNFSRSIFQRTFRLTNSGRRHQSIIWSTEGFPLMHRSGKKKLPAIQVTNGKDIKLKDSPPELDPARPVFCIIPQRLEMNPGDSFDVLLQGTSDIAQTVREKLLCHAIIGRGGGKELIKKVQIVCDFINPLLEFSTDSLLYAVCKSPDDQLAIQSASLEMKNISSLPLTAKLSLEEPFYLQVHEDGRDFRTTDHSVRFDVGEVKCLTVLFNPAYKQDFHSRSVEGLLTVSYQEHPHVDSIKLQGEVFFPNLQFEKTVVDFGCIINNTEVTRYLNVTNNSPMKVDYRWSFVLDNQPVAMFRKPPHHFTGHGFVMKREDEDSNNGTQLNDCQYESNDALGKLEAEVLDVTIEHLADSPRNLQSSLSVENNEKKLPLSDEDDDGDEKKDEEKPDSPHSSRVELFVGNEQESYLLSARVASPRTTEIVNPHLASLLQQDNDDRAPPGVEEIFDILPIYGSLNQGEMVQTTFTFYGHANIVSEARAICEVEGGPTYEITLKGEASLIDYKFDFVEIDYNKIMYEQVAEAQITLHNTGHVGFKFVGLGMDPCLTSCPRPGVPVMTPHSGHINPQSEQVLTVKYLPRGPQKFRTSFQIQVAHFEPQTIQLYGEGVFPRVNLNLPLLASERPELVCGDLQSLSAASMYAEYQRLLAAAKENLTNMEKKVHTNRPASVISDLDEANSQLHQIDADYVPEIEIQMEIERLLVLEAVCDQLEEVESQSDILVIDDDVAHSRASSKSLNKKPTKFRPILPEYLLDFGHVVLGNVCSRTVTITNTGWFPVSFSIDRASRHQSGFSVDLPRVVQLPGAPDHETVDFTVTFDPRGANLGTGAIEAFININVVGGPLVRMCLRANVTIPDLQISTDIIEFGQVKCGECRIVTIQLHNHQAVHCEWIALPLEDNKKQIDKHIPMHLRRKIRPEKPTPSTFEIIPSSGSLQPAQRQNIQVKFMPAEQKNYENRLVIKLSQSSQRVVVMCRGQGQEPHIEFDRPLVEFGPILPHSSGDEKEIVIRNPCKFAVEIYNLEFDKLYLDEEKILRLMIGYDEFNTLLLPPRLPGEKLPQELLDYYDEQMKKVENAEKEKRESDAGGVAKNKDFLPDEEKVGSTVTLLKRNVSEVSRPSRTSHGQLSSRVVENIEAKDSKPAQSFDTQAVSVSPEEKRLDKSSTGVGDLETTPVSAAIARHLGIDITQDGQAARSRRGIVIVVHGAPMSGKSTTSASLARRYDIPVVRLDDIIMASFSSGTLSGGQARELCAEAARRIADDGRHAEDALLSQRGGQPGGGLSSDALTVHTQATGGVSQSVPQSLTSNRKTSTVASEARASKHHGSSGGKTGGNLVGHSGEGNSQVFSSGSPIPLFAHKVQRLSLGTSLAGDDGLVNTILPEDLIVSILSERLMREDCNKGVVFDGLESMFTQSYVSSALALLKAVNNRKYIYTVSLKLDYNSVKEKEKQYQEEKERLEREKEEQEKRHLEEMSEDEYDALTEQQKADVDKQRLVIKKERLRRERAERLERERREEEERKEAELRKQEEDRLRRGRKRGGAAVPPEKSPKKVSKVADANIKEKPAPVAAKISEVKKSHESAEIAKAIAPLVPDNKPEITIDVNRGESALDDRKKRDKSNKRPVSTDVSSETKPKSHGEGESMADELPKEKDVKSDAEVSLINRFRVFEHSFKEVCELFDWWERSTGMLHPGAPTNESTADASDESHHPPPGKKGKQDRNKDKHEPKAKGKESQYLMEPTDVDRESNQGPSEEEKQEKRLQEGIGIPHIVVNCADSNPTPTEYVVSSGKLPPVEEVLDGLGLGPKGPPIPSPASFAVVPYPVKRQSPIINSTSRCSFTLMSQEDTSAATQDDKSVEHELEDAKLAEDRNKEHANTTSTKAVSRRGATKQQQQQQQQQHDGKTKDQRRKSPSGKSRSSGRRTSVLSSPPPDVGGTPGSEQDGSGTEIAPTEIKIPKVYRWVIPAEGEIVLKLCFSSEECGQFDQTLNFEITGTRRRYQLFCRGICAFPNISCEPRLVFPHRKKTLKVDEIVQKKYILATDIFEFGPLLAGKSRDKYKEGKNPENMEKINIVNSSPLDAEITFCFLNDSKGDIFLLDPPSMSLKPAQQQELTLWAYPKASGVYDDALVCCVKENPEPVIFKLRSHGVRPEIELDKKALHFDKVLLHRKDTKTLCLKNKTMLPVAWHLTGLEALSDDFSVSQEGGVIQPKSEFILSVYFRALKPIVTNKKAIRIEVSDVDNIMGLLQTEVVTIHAEAYDVALDMSFPKGTEGGIDFDATRVLEETKQTCTLKNKGKYDITYSFSFEPTPECPRDVCNMFTVTPQQGTLSPSERAANVQVTFKSNREVTVREQPILRCQVIEPSIGDSGEMIASIPVKVSVRSLFIRYSINPMSDINFGALMLNSKKTRTFTIENTGEKFDLKYTISKALRDETNAQAPESGKPKRGGEAGTGQLKLTFGMFTLYPSFGTIQPGAQQTVTVDCFAESQGPCEENVYIDIVGREPKDNPGGIPYRFIAEACIPSINVDDIGSIFEEHRICRSLSLGGVNMGTENISDTGLRLSDQLCGGVYGEEDRKFIFCNALVGVKSKARIKISNIKKVPCDVSFSIKPLVAIKTTTRQQLQEVFEVTPARVQIPPHRHAYAIVTFCPPAMQQYGAIFEASIDVTPANQPKGRSLSFELSGEGNLPRISVVRPTLRNKRGQPLLLFRRTLIGQTHTLPIFIVNDGTVTCKVDVAVADPDDVFSLRAVGSGGQTVRNAGGRSKSAILDINESTTFEVTYKASAVQRCQGQVRLTVVDNQYEDLIVQLVAESYSDDIIIDCIGNIAETETQDDVTLAEDDIPATKSNVMKFGDCYINDPRTLAFTMSNRSNNSLRFVWPELQHLKFVPRIGHLHPGGSKDVSVTFKVERPIRLTENDVTCRVSQITFDRSLDEVADWDDRLKTVKWVAASRHPSSSDGSPTGSAVLPTRKKVIEVEPEPTFTELAESVRSVSLLVSANADYCKYHLKEESLRFRDTLMFQTRVYQLQLNNVGSVAVEYSWQVIMDDFNAVRTAVGGNQTVAVARPSSSAETPRPATAGPLIVRSDAGLRSTSVLSGDFNTEEINKADRMAASGPPYVPFIVEPASGVVSPGKTAVVTVKFSPLDVNEYEGRLLCSIPNLQPGSHGPVVGVRARSLLPYCHFELEDSDYIRAGRRNPDLPGPGGASALDPNTRVIEFQSAGIGVSHTVKFDVINPTNQNYSFVWTCEDVADPKRTPHFTCHARNGTILSGKKAQMSFEYRSSSLDCIESFWKFEIFEQNVSISFLLVGQTHDPNITFDRSHVNFRSILIGHEASSTVNLINREDEPLSYSIVDSSCQAAGYAVRVVVEPMQGVVPPKSKLPVTVKFTPTWEKEVNFNVMCSVKRKLMPLSLNVKAEGYSMNCLVTCEDPSGEKTEFSSTVRNHINFGRVEVKDKAVRTISVINLGQYMFNYSWELKYQSSLDETGKTSMITGRGNDSNVLTLIPLSGSIAQGEKAACLLTFMPPAPLSMKNCELVLKVSLGPTFVVQVSGSGVVPGLQFSTLSYNFGPCFVYRPEMPMQSYALKLTNSDKKDISVECLYQSTAWLTHNFDAHVLAPQQTVDVVFSFCPREPIKYKETVTFEINGLSRQSVEFTGQGTELKIEVAEPRHRIVKFGALRIGQTVKKIIPIVNNSAAPLTFKVTANPLSPALQESGVMRLLPTDPITLQQKGGMGKVEVVLSPKCRIAQFSEEIHLECAGLFQTLFIVTGSCQGLEIAFDTESVPFGAVVQNSSSTRQVILNNTGDIGARFKWDVSKLGANFTLTPLEGYISAGMDVPFDVVFHPKDVNSDIRCENIKCQVEGLPKPLRLTLTGSCVGVQPTRDVTHFTTHVRQKESKSLQVPNHSTSMTYNLRPVIDGAEYWSGPEMLVVPPQSTKYYELTYNPMTMTTDGKKHTGSVFFPLPDGQGLMYHVSGVAEPPKANGKMTRDVSCKTTITETLSVHNWLKKAQRFRMKIECVKPDKLDAGTSIKGLEYIDVPGMATRDYKLTFHSHKECQPLVKVTFLNEQTGEYQFYEIQFRAARPGVLATIQLSTLVRQRKQHTVSLENPLTSAVTFSASCTVPDIQMPSQLVVPPMSEGAFSFEYFPMKAGAAQGKLEFTSNDLGFYQYDIELRALPAGPEKALNFQTYLGSSQPLIAKFLNFAKHKTDYTCKLDHADYHVDKSIAAAPAASSGTEVVIEVVFEPSSVGETRATLVISSPLGGDYTFPLVGVCLPPKPQGPFVIKTGSNVSIPFRNVFAQTMTFQFTVDNPVFHIAKPTETIRSRKEHRVVVAYDGSDSAMSKAPVVGRLVISCVRTTGGPVAGAAGTGAAAGVAATPPNTQWVFYLKGVTPDGKDSK